MSLARKPAVLGFIVLLSAGAGVVRGAAPGTIIAVPSDRKAAYSVIETSTSPGGTVIILTKRVGPSGTSYVRRECTCPVSSYRVLGEGESVVDAKISREPTEKFASLVYNSELGMGSVSWHICEFACRYAR